MTAKKKTTSATKTPAIVAHGPRLRVLESWHIELDPATITGLKAHARRLEIPFEMLVATGLRAWKGALSEEKNCGLTFPVRIGTKLPGED